MQVAQILSSQLIPGATVLDLTPDDGELSVKSLLSPELRLTYRSELEGISGDRPRHLLLVQKVSHGAAWRTIGAELKRLAESVVLAVFTPRIQALLDDGILAAATNGEWELTAVHAAEHPVWQTVAFFRPARAEQGAAELELMNELRGKEALRAAQIQRLEWKLNRRNERVRELEGELSIVTRSVAELRRSLDQAVSRARKSEARFEQYRRALIKTRSSISFRVGRATKLALRAGPLELPQRWIDTFTGEDEILAKLDAQSEVGGADTNRPIQHSKRRTLPLAAASGETANSGFDIAAWWNSKTIMRFRKPKQRVLGSERRSNAAVVAPDPTQQWLHIVNAPPPGSAPDSVRLQLPPATDELPSEIDLAAFEQTWRYLCETRANAASIGKLVGKPMADLDEALRTLLPALAGKRLVDEAVTPVANLVIRIPNFRSYSLPTPIDWAADPRGTRDWRFWLQNLGWLDRLSGKYGLAAAAYVVTDWTERVLTQDPPLEMTWEEHSIGVRLARVWRFLQAYIESSEVLNRRVLHAAVHIVLTHIYALTRRGVYVPEHNHGLMQDQALLTHVAQLPALHDHERLMQLGEFRVLQLQVVRSVTQDAVHHENSPHYHILFAKVLATLLNEVYARHGRKPPQALIEARDALLETFIYLLQPDLTVPQFGDSVNESRNPELEFVLQQAQLFPLPAELLAQIQYVRTDGREGHPPPYVDRVFAAGGYACFREHWAPGRAQKVIVAHFRCSCLSKVHYHKDETSFEIYGYGRKLIAESGRYNNDKGSAMHDYQRSTHAHNVLTVDGRGFGPSKSPSSIVAHRLGRSLSWVQGTHDYFSTLGIKEFCRTFAYSKYNFFVVLDSLRAEEGHVYEQHFHLHPSLSRVSFPAPDTAIATTEEGGGPVVVLTSGTTPDAIRTVRGLDPASGGQSWYFPNDNVAEPATDVVFRYSREAGRVHLPLFITIFPSEDAMELFPIEHEITDTELAVAIEKLRYARHIVIPLYDFKLNPLDGKASRELSSGQRKPSTKVAATD